jgi:cytoskeletal protein CcmA (bactofilin family)
MRQDAKRELSPEPSSLGRGVAIKGKITGDGDLSVEGTVDGEVAIGGNLHVAPEAQVKAQVQAASAVVEGSFEGDLQCDGAVRATAGSKVNGTIRAAGFCMEDGAVVSASVECDFEMPAELA